MNANVLHRFCVRFLNAEGVSGELCVRERSKFQTNIAKTSACEMLRTQHARHARQSSNTPDRFRFDIQFQLNSHG